MYALWLVLALAFFNPQENGASPELVARALSQAAQHRQEAIRLNELLGHVRSEAEARAIVDSVAKMFERELPPAWATREVRLRVARAEYESASDRSRLIPERRIADVWNEYVREIGAPDEALVTAAEVHSLRDGQHASGVLFWSKGMNQSVWTMPNVAAVGADGKVADGCRALEAIGLIYNMGRSVDNIRMARENVRKGIVASDRVRTELEDSGPPRSKLVASTRLTVSADPFRPAEQRYVSEHGVVAFDRLLGGLFDRLFPE